jgi:hypothetical protein
MENRQSDRLCSCFNSLKEAIDIVVEDHGTVSPKKVFKTLLRIRQWQLLTSLFKTFLSSNLDASSFALSFDRGTCRIRSFHSCCLNRFGSEVLFSGSYWSSEECWLASGEKAVFTFRLFYKCQSIPWRLCNWWIVIMRNWPLWSTKFYAAERPVTLSQQKQQSWTWFFGSHHAIGTVKGIASRFHVVRPVTQFIWTCCTYNMRCPVLSLIS